VSVNTLSGLSQNIRRNICEGLQNDKMRKKALDAEFHQINEAGGPAAFSEGLVIKLAVGGDILMLLCEYSVAHRHTLATCPLLDVAVMGGYDPHYDMTEGEIECTWKCHNSRMAILFVCGGF